MAGRTNAELFVEFKTGTPMALADTNASDFIGAGVTASPGLVPSPGNSGSTNRYLNETGVWAQIQASQIAGLVTAAVFYTGCIPLVNAGIHVSASSSSLVINVLNVSGSVPTTTSPAIFAFRASASTDGNFIAVSVATSITLTVPSGATLGVTASQAFRLWLVGVHTSGNVNLGIINCLSGNNIFSLKARSFNSVTLTAITTGSDSAHTFYGGSAATGMFSILGAITYEGGVATIGEWSVNPTNVMLSRLGQPYPGDMVSRWGTQTGAAASGNTAIPVDDTIPTSSEGTEFITATAQFSSRANLYKMDSQLQLAGVSVTGVGNGPIIAYFRDTTTAAFAVTKFTNLNLTNFNNRMSALAATFWAKVDVTPYTDTVFRARAGVNTETSTGGTKVVFNGISNAAAADRQFGGVANSYLNVEEYFV